QGAVRILDTESGKEVRTFPRDARDVDHCALAFTPDGKLLASLGDSGALRIEEVVSGTEILRQQFPRDILANLAMSADGSMLAVAPGANNRKLYVWKGQAGEEPRELKVGEFTARSLSFSPDGKLLAGSGDRGTTVLVWDVASGRPVHRLDVTEPGHVASS